MDANARVNLQRCQVTHGQDACLSCQYESLGNGPGSPPGWHLTVADYLQTHHRHSRRRPEPLSGRDDQPLARSSAVAHPIIR